MVIIGLNRLGSRESYMVIIGLNRLCSRESYMVIIGLNVQKINRVKLEIKSLVLPL